VAGPTWKSTGQAVPIAAKEWSLIEAKKCLITLLHASIACNQRQVIQKDAAIVALKKKGCGALLQEIRNMGSGPIVLDRPQNLFLTEPMVTNDVSLFTYCHGPTEISASPSRVIKNPANKLITSSPWRVLNRAPAN